MTRPRPRRKKPMTSEEVKEYHRRKSKEWYLKPGNKERRKKYMGIWRANNKDKILRQQRKFYHNHRDEFLPKMRANSKIYYARKKENGNNNNNKKNKS